MLLFRVLLTLLVVTISPTWIQASSPVPANQSPIGTPTPPPTPPRTIQYPPGTATPPPTPNPPGSWNQIKLTPDLETLLYNALKNETQLSDSQISWRLCALDIVRIESQVVAGMNYRFALSACDVFVTLAQGINIHSGQRPDPATISKNLGKCSADFAKTCAKLGITITIYKKWDGTVQVSTIDPGPVPAPTPTPPVTYITGGYSPIPLSSDLSMMLYTNLIATDSYNPSVQGRVCIKSISLVETQVVAGRNYRFTTISCDIRQTLAHQASQQQSNSAIARYLGLCQPEFAKSCVEVDAKVTVYKKLDNSTHVWSIEATARHPTPAKVHASDTT